MPTIAGATSPFGSEPESVASSGEPVNVIKTADQATISVGAKAGGYVVTITNTGGSTATGLTLSDPLPTGSGNNLTWSIDTTGTGRGAGTNPVDFQVSSGNLVFSSAFISGGDSLGAGASISVHILSNATTIKDLGSNDPALGAAGNFAVLYEGTGGHNLQITNVSINGNVGVGGTGHVQFNGPWKHPRPT